jgi:hypothetical protein
VAEITTEIVHSLFLLVVRPVDELPLYVTTALRASFVSFSGLPGTGGAV